MQIKNGKYWLVCLALIISRFPVFGQISLEAKTSKIYFETLPSGLQYKYFLKPDTAEMAGEGGYLVFNILLKTSKDSIFHNTFNTSNPAATIVPQPTYAGCLNDGLAMLKGGDSIVFKVIADSFYTKTFEMGLPLFFQPGDEIIILVKVLESKNKLTFEAFEAEKVRKEKEIAAQQLDEDIKLLKAGAAKMGYTQQLQSTASGLMFVKLKGTKEQKPQYGDELSFYYTGKFLNGEKFDGNIGKEPFKVTLGNASVIDGWLEMVDQIKLGEKWLLFVPSGLAYGKNGAGTIDPNTPLIFEVELVKIKSAKQIKAEEEILTGKQKIDEVVKLANFITSKRYKNLVRESLDSTEFFYLIEKEGTGSTIQLEDTAIIRAKAFDLDGNAIAMLTAEEPVSLQFQDFLAPLIKSALLKMKKGSVIRLISPSKLLQGEQGGVGIAPYTPVMLEMEVVDIKKGKK